MKDTKQFALRDKIVPYLSGQGEIAIPEHLIQWVEIAADLDADRDAGCVFPPDSLSVGAWACLRGLTQGRARAENARQNEPTT